MTESSNRAVVEEYARALPGDMKTLARLRHPDFTEDWLQSGERMRGQETYEQVHDRYPGGLPTLDVEKVTGNEDRWVVSPNYTLLRVTGTGDEYTLEFRADYPDGSQWFLIGVLTLKDGKVHRQRSYFAPRFEAPAWRADLVERIEA